MSADPQSVLRSLPCFVISLPRDEERRAHMQAQLSTLALSAEFIPAVDGRTLGGAELAAYDRQRALQVYGVEMMPTEIGCFLSHYRLYERMLREDLDVALIMEDDLEIKPEFPAILADLLADAAPPWLVVRFESQRGRVREPRTRKDRGTTVRQLSAGELVKLNIHVLGLGAYLIRREGAQRMVAYGRQIFMPIDQAMDRFWESGIEPYVVRPMQVRQRPDLVSRIGARAYERRAGVPLWVKFRRRLQRMSDSFNKRWYWLRH